MAQSFAAYLTEQTQAAKAPSGRPLNPNARAELTRDLAKAQVILQQLQQVPGDDRMLDVAARQASNICLYLNDALRSLVIRNGGMR